MTEARYSHGATAPRRRTAPPDDVATSWFRVRVLTVAAGIAGTGHENAGGHGTRTRCQDQARVMITGALVPCRAHRARATFLVRNSVAPCLRVTIPCLTVDLWRPVKGRPT